MESRAARFPYWILPLISAATWFAMLWALLIVWLAQGRPHYPSMERGEVAYISDIGASGVKPLFVAGCAITSAFFFASLLSMRRNQLLQRRRERVYDWISLASGFMGSVGLILLSIFDTAAHPMLHRLFLFLFMLGIVLSALFTTLEYRSLGKTFTDHPILKHSYNGKRILLVIEVALSFAFGVMLYKRKQNPGAILEWVISFVFTFYVLTFFFDLRPTARTKGQLQRDREMAEISRRESEGGNRSAPGRKQNSFMQAIGRGPGQEQHQNGSAV